MQLKARKIQKELLPFPFVHILLFLSYIFIFFSFSFSPVLMLGNLYIFFSFLDCQAQTVLTYKEIFSYSRSFFATWTAVFTLIFCLSDKLPLHQDPSYNHKLFLCDLTSLR